MQRYPRDMGGYGPVPPTADWPGGARIAVQFVLNYEEGGERCLLHGDTESEAFLSEIVGAAAWPGQRHWNMESIYEYGARAGFWRIHRLFTERLVPVTVFGVATALARAPEQVAAMVEAGWEIASHGLKWIDYKDHSEDEERAEIAAAKALHAAVTGERPRGWYTGRCSANTVRLIAEDGEFDYVADSYADDLPYWLRIGERDQLVVPYTLDANDMRFATPQGFNSGDQFEAYLRDSFDMLYAEGVAGAPKMLSVGLHCRLVGRPGRLAALRRFLDHMDQHDGVWIARRIDIAEHWRQKHPPSLRVRPSEMPRAEFVSQFGDVFERSPWIAERAHALELGPAHDSAVGLHNALVRIFRMATREERLTVLRGHPDLAGKFATASDLTDASAAEQSSAGLDVLTGSERAEFTALNARYTERFGFPFIIAVRDHQKGSILASFRQRLEHEPDHEFAEACRQVERIALLRLRLMLP
ncbi:MAG: allantoinase PuuE [Pseudomonadota bacterium]